MMFPVLPGATPSGIDVHNAACTQGVLSATDEPEVPLPLVVGKFPKLRDPTHAPAMVKRTAAVLARSKARKAAVVKKPGEHHHHPNAAVKKPARATRGTFAAAAKAATNAVRRGARPNMKEESQRSVLQARRFSSSLTVTTSFIDTDRTMNETYDHKQPSELH